MEKLEQIGNSNFSKISEFSNMTDSDFLVPYWISNGISLTSMKFHWKYNREPKNQNLSYLKILKFSKNLNFQFALTFPFFNEIN